MRKCGSYYVSPSRRAYFVFSVYVFERILLYKVRDLLTNYQRVHYQGVLQAKHVENDVQKPFKGLYMFLSNFIEPIFVSSLFCFGDNLSIRCALHGLSLFLGDNLSKRTK